MPTVDFMFFDAGGGHRAAATALKLAIERQNLPWTVRMVHLQDILDQIDVFKKILRIDLQEIYNQMLKRGWTLGSTTGLRFMQQVIRMLHPSQVKLLAEHWRRQPADMVVSLVPNFNRAMYEGFARACPGRPYVTVLTDIADYPPRFWMEPQQQWVVCGSAKAAGQAAAMGYPAERVSRVSGMILHPRFYDLPEVDRAARRRELGLDPDTPTAVVLFGGFGSKAMLGILKRLDASGLNMQAILIAGRNDRLRERLEAMPTRMKKHVVGFTNEVPSYMLTSDFFIGKPGPGSLSEAIHLGLPAITVSNSWTLPQERYNAEWLTENGLGMVLDSFDGIDVAVSRMLAGTSLADMRARAATFDNRAVWEIPGILQQILDLAR
ncbi:MAG: galactosyldiacylglycerol synthase [Bryobacteraceae bacterium]|nr:galactosyldiacylglycerol synthase [Bryobacteraceae bacterium]